MPDIRWIELEPELLNQSQPHVETSGVEVIVGLSPFDVPDAVRGYQDDTSNRFIIEFRYLGEAERRVPQEIDDNVTLRVGENSNRLYEIWVDVDTLKADTVSLTLLVDQAMQRYARDDENPRKRALSQMAKKVLKQKGPELMSVH